MPDAPVKQRAMELTAWDLKNRCSVSSLTNVLYDYTPEMRREDDIAFAREIDCHSIPFHSAAWPRIGELQRAGLLRIVPINRWVAEAYAVGDAARNDPIPA